MSVLRFIAIILIIGGVSVAWFVLGGSMYVRTNDLDNRTSQEMDNLWGPSVLAQVWPYVADRAGELKNGEPPAGAKITAVIRHENRSKGLLWFNTFTVDFDAVYTFEPSSGGREVSSLFLFPLPQGTTKLDDPRVSVDDVPRPVTVADMKEGRLAIPLEPGKQHVVKIAYRTYGRDVWVYSPAAVACHRERLIDLSDESSQIKFNDSPLSQLKNFSLTIKTDFTDIDYPKGTSSPTAPAQADNGGKSATWQYANALTRQAMGVVVPKPLNAGPVAMRMIFFAPVSLLFFFTSLFAVVVIKKIPLHPMHYLFIAAGFFAFHILLAYLLDSVSIHFAFWICAVVSILLVVSYMRLVAGVRFAVTWVALAQLVYLVGFSYAFFLPGKTGLIVTIGAIVTLFLLMQLTGRVNWGDLFSRRQSPPPPLAPPASPPPPPMPVQLE